IACVFLCLFPKNGCGAGHNARAIRNRPMTPIVSVERIGFGNGGLEFAIADRGERLNDLPGRRIDALVEHWDFLA
ncbi:MAG TPA: hypothetical protein VL492_12565, partial [Methylovirgula sp.]|nr:hypothetical protein [Methylovirgula sp.]